MQTTLYSIPVYTRDAFGKEEFHVIWDIVPAGSGFEGMGGAGTSGGAPAGATLSEGTIESADAKKKTFGNFEPSSSEAKGLHGQVFNCKFTKVEAESAEEAMKWAAEVYGQKGTLAAVPKEAKKLEFKKA